MKKIIKKKTKPVSGAQGDDSVNKVLATQMEGDEFESPEPTLKTGYVPVISEPERWR